MDHMERRQNEELMEARRLRRQEQKRKLLMRQRVLAAVLLVIFVLSLILILRGCRNRREHPELYAKKDTTLQLETEPDTTVTISAVGDIMITDELLADAKQPDGSYLISCSADLADLFDLFSLEDECDANTVSGWVMEQVGRVPEVGDHFQAEGLDVTVTRVEHRRVLEIQVRVLGTEA